MDGLTFYSAYGKDLVRKSAGPSKEQIMTGENFARTRENLSEFSGCSKISKSFRDSLVRLLPLADGQMRNRVTKVFKIVTAQDEGTRGARPIRLSRHRDAFKDFECNIKRGLFKSLPVLLATTHSEDRTTATVTIPAGIAIIDPPPGATHFRLEHGLGIVSDFIYSAEVKRYTPTDPTLNTQSTYLHSDYFPLEEETTAPYTSTVSLSLAPPLPDTVSVVNAFGIAFFQRIGGIHARLEQGHALKVMEVF